MKRNTILSVKLYNVQGKHIHQGFRMIMMMMMMMESRMYRAAVDFPSLFGPTGSRRTQSKLVKPVVVAKIEAGFVPAGGPFINRSSTALQLLLLLRLLPLLANQASTPKNMSSSLARRFLCCRGALFPRSAKKKKNSQGPPALPVAARGGATCRPMRWASFV